MRYDDAIAAFRDEPLNLPSPSRREDARTAILAMARLPVTRPRPRRRALLLGGVVGMLAAAAAVLAIDPQTPSHTHATITAHPNTRYMVLSASPDELVQLDEGAIDVEVAPLHRKERFRVIVGDSEVEVHGTAFEVVAAERQLVAVTVRHGRVEVRPAGGSRTFLTAGQGWHVTPPAPIAAPAPAPVEPPPPPAPKPRRVRALAQPLPPPPPKPVERPAEELAYDDAWGAMRAKNFSRAADSFTRVLILAPDAGIAEDAAFWQAVALARGQRRAQAITAFRDFLDAHSRSPHAGEANAMVGWLLLDAGEPVEAARRFRAAADDPRKSVRDSARSGLDALPR